MLSPVNICVEGNIHGQPQSCLLLYEGLSLESVI